MKLTINFFALFCFVLLFSLNISAQQDKPRASLKASVSQIIGVDTEIKFEFSRPGVKGRKIWGEVVPYGLEPGNQYSKNKPFPWRGGANENTTVSFSKDVLVEGNLLPAGKYGLHFIPSQTDWIVIFSKNSSLWGSYLYNEEEDALRIKVTPIKDNHQEWLIYGFEDLAGNTATAFLHWAELKIPIKISVAGN